MTKIVNKQKFKYQWGAEFGTVMCGSLTFHPSPVGMLNVFQARHNIPVHL